MKPVIERIVIPDQSLHTEACMGELNVESSQKYGEELIFKNVKVKMGEKMILDDVSGYVRPGEILALMGPSGAGKTSLLNFLSLRHELLGSSRSGISGTLMVNNVAMTKKDSKRIGYVMQTDILFEAITLKETVEFYAKVRSPRTMSRSEKISKAMELVKLMSLEKSLNTMIGGGLIRGLSGGEKKRASIVIEMISNPNLLFLDEPTSGLDSNMAMILIDSLKNLAHAKNKAIISSIHQPNSQIFFGFTKLLLLSKGKTAYFGPLSMVVPFFDSISLKCPPSWNAADFIIDKVRSDPDTIKTILNGYKNQANVIDPTLMSKLCQKEIVSNSPHTVDQNETATYGCQLEALTRRSFFKALKDRWTLINLIRYIFLAVIIGIVFFETKINDLNIFSFFGLIFFTTVNHIIDPMFTNLLEFGAEFIVVKKENLSGTYSLSAYYIAKVVSEAPMNFLRPVIMWTIVYWMTGLSCSVWFLASLGHMMLLENFGQSIGLLIGSLGLSFNETMTVANVYFIFALLVGGLYNSNLPYWLVWVKYLSPVHYGYSTQVWLQLLSDGGIKCVTSTNDTLQHIPSPLQSCNSNKTYATPIEAIKLIPVTIDVGYYTLLTFAFMILAHFGALFMLSRSIKRPINRKSIEQRIREKNWTKICNPYKKETLSKIIIE